MLTILLPEEDAPLPEALEHQPVELVWPGAAGDSLILTVGGRALEPFLRPGDAAWRWRWNPGAAVGLHVIRLEGDATRQWRLRVAPLKIDQERYALLLEDVERLAAGLAFTLAGAGAEGASPSPEAGRPSPAEQYYALFGQQLDALERAARRILARPREQLRPAASESPLGGPGAPTPDVLARAAQGRLQPAPPGLADELQRAIRADGGLLPESMPAARAAPSADTYEHRLLRRVLELLASRARRIGDLAARTAQRLERADPTSARAARAREVAAGCAAAAPRIRELRAAPLLADVAPLQAIRGPTPLIQRDPSYREVYRAWLALHRAPVVTVSSPLLEIPLAELPRLYETWCALTVAQALLQLGEPEGQGLVAATRPADGGPDDLECVVALPEGHPLLRVRRGGALLTLRYQARYAPWTRDQRPTTKGQSQRAKGRSSEAAEPGDPQTRQGPDTDAARVAQPLVLGPSSLASLDRHTRVPDLAIEIERPGAPPRVLVLDAKYRLDAEGGVPQDALADAYAYLGAIGAGGARATVGAAILYPGKGAPERYPSDVGGIPLIPGKTDELPSILAAWLG